MHPHAREDRLVLREVADEVLVYDLSRHEAHCLNRTAALVWRECDGRTPVDQIARRLAQDLGAPADEAMVWMALERLDRAHLLRERLAPRRQRQRYTRREVLRRMGRVSSVALLPVVATIVAPRAAQAASCVTNCTGRPSLTACEPPSCAKRCCTDQQGVMKCVSFGDQTCNPG